MNSLYYYGLQSLYENGLYLTTEDGINKLACETKAWKNNINNNNNNLLKTEIQRLQQENKRLKQTTVQEPEHKPEQITLQEPEPEQEYDVISIKDIVE